MRSRRLAQERVDFLTLAEDRRAPLSLTWRGRQVAAPCALAVGLLACDEHSSREAQARQPSAPQGVQMDSPFQHEATPPGSSRGRKFEDPDFSLTTEPAKVCQQTGPFVPQEGMRRLSVPITVEATGTRSVPLSALAFQLVDGQGHLYGATLAGCDAPLDTQTLVSGARASGAIAFDVPLAATDLEVQFEPFLIGRPKVSARAEVALPEASK